MRGNDYQKIKENMEDEIIKRIDIPARRRIRVPRPIQVLLRVPIIELITYKAAMTGRAIRLGV